MRNEKSVLWRERASYGEDIQVLKSEFCPEFGVSAEGERKARDLKVDPRQLERVFLELERVFFKVSVQKFN